jgi:hypothetical protein
MRRQNGREALISGLDSRQRRLAGAPRVQIADDLQRLIEKPRLVALCGAAALAARRLIHRDVRDRALRLTARRMIEKVDRNRDRRPAPLALLLLLPREAKRVAHVGAPPASDLSFNERGRGFFFDAMAFLRNRSLS